MNSSEGTSYFEVWTYQLHGSCPPWPPMRKCILIVDDNARMRKLVRAVVEERADCELCGEAVNGQDAIEKAEKLRPDLIVLDLVMPVMNGLEAARALHNTMPQVPLVMLTDHTYQLVEPDALAAGFSLVISKEDSVEKLPSLCLDILSRPSFSP